jgi:cytochrome c-type biogenesis protein CcmH/NrfG
MSLGRVRRKRLPDGYVLGTERGQPVEAQYAEGGSGEWVARLTRLQEALTLCPHDLSARGHLAALLERLGQHEEALFNWTAVLACDPGNLKAREGVARCRERSGRPLQSDV